MVNTRVQVHILPDRLLLSNTTQKLASKLSKIDGIEEILIHGPRIPKRIPYGPGRGMANPHSDRIKIEVENKETDLKVKVGKMIIDIDKDKLSLENAIPKIREICDEVISCDYQIKKGDLEETPTKT